MAISIIGTPQVANQNNGGTATVTWSTRPSTDDYTVVVVGSPAATPADCSMVTAGYTRLAYRTGAAAANPSLAVFYKKQGATTDTTGAAIADGAATTDTSIIGFVLRGVDLTTFSDATPTTAGETTSTNPDPASISGASANFCTIVAALMTVLEDTSITAPSGYTGFSQVGSDTYDHTLAAAYKLNCTAPEAPASWTNWGSGLWYAITIAVKPAATPINVTTTLDELVLTEYNPIVSKDITFTAGLDELALTEYNPTVSLDVNITTTLDELAITEYNPTVSKDISFTAGIDELVLTEYNPTVSLDVNITTTLDELAITTYNPTVSKDISFTAGLDELTITTYNPTVTVAGNIEVQATLDELILTEYNPTVSKDISFTAGLDELALTEYNPTVSLDTNIQAGIDELTITTYPTIVSKDISFTTGIDELVITTYPAIVSIGAMIDQLGPFNNAMASPFEVGLFR